MQRRLDEQQVHSKKKPMIAGRTRAGPVSSGLPASAATGRCFHSYRASSVPRSGLGRCDHRHGFTLRVSIIFWTPRDVQSPRPPTTALVRTCGRSTVFLRNNSAPLTRGFFCRRSTSCVETKLPYFAHPSRDS